MALRRRSGHTASALSENLVAHIRQIVREETSHHPRTMRGYVRPGSWNPGQNTIDVDVAHVVGVTNDDGSAPLNPLRNVPLLTHGLGAQYGPRGGEVVTLFFRGDSPVAVLQHEDYNSPQVPSGEHHVVHYSAQGQVDQRLAFTNDGATAGDGAGGWTLSFGTIAVIAALTGGFIGAVFNASANRVLLGSKTLDDIQDAVTTQRYFKAGIEALRASTQAAITTLAATVESGSGVPPPTVADVSVAGSTIVKAAP